MRGIPGLFATVSKPIPIVLPQLVNSTTATRPRERLSAIMPAKAGIHGNTRSSAPSHGFLLWQE